MTDLFNTYKDLNDKLDDVYSRINDLQRQIADIDNQLGSFVTNAWQFLGYNESAVLQDKKQTLQQELEPLYKLAAVFQKEIESIKKQALTNKQQLEVKLRDAEEKNYLSSPDNFFKEVLFENNVVSQISSEEIYAHARRIIAASAVINTQPNKYRMVRALQIVSEAKNRSFNEYKFAASKTDKFATEENFYVSEEFARGAKTCFFNMVDKLSDPDCQALKILYIIDPEKAEWYFTQSIDTDAKILQKLHKEIEERLLKTAKDRLEEIKGFTNLDSATQAMLIQQQQYVNKLDLDLSYATENNPKDFEIIKTLTNDLRTKIKNAILNNRTPVEIQLETDLLRQKIDAEAESIRSDFFKQKLTESPGVAASVGVTALMTGFGMPVALAATAMAAAAKSKFQTSDKRLQMPKIDDYKKLVEEIDPQALEFIRKADLNWTRADQAPKARTLKDDITEKVESTKNLIIDKVLDKTDELYEEKIQKPLDNAYYSAQKLYIALFVGITAVLISIAIAFPATLPFVGVIMGIGIAAVAYEYMPTGKSLTATLPRLSSNSEFVFPKEAIKELQKYAPSSGNDIAQLLSQHFNGRFDTIKSMLDNAKAKKNSNITQEVAAAIQQLENDWQIITQAAKQPDMFCQKVEDYLENCYEQAREKYIASSKTTDIPALQFSQKSNVNIDYVAKEKEINELITLKNKVSQIKNGLM